jgi:transforming growth factor-beta-induced protein
MKRKMAAALGGILALALTASAFAADRPADPATAPAPSQDGTADIVDTAVAAGDFTTLVAAVQAAGLEETLRGEGPFTVFAPTDAAFAALPEGTVEALLADPDALREVLLYHVVAGSVPAEDVVGLTSAETVQGSAVSIEVVGGSVVLNGESTVIATDVEASNGIIHVIDAVLLPPDDQPVPSPAAAGNAGLLGSDSGGTNAAAYALVALGAAFVLGGGALALRRVR